MNEVSGEWKKIIVKDLMRWFNHNM